MKTWLRKLRGGTVRTATPALPHARLELEALEDRVVPTVTYHGGALLSRVEAQALYLGSDWQSNPVYHQQTGLLEQYLKGLVTGSYLDMLAGAGYGVGPGSASPGRIGDVRLDKNYALSDAAIQGYLQTYISKGVLQPPNAERLYVVFVEDNVLVRTSDGLISRTDFLGYHGAFAGRDAGGQLCDVRYAVIAYPGGAISNAAVAGVSAINDLTEVASHEVAEAITDPDVNYSVLGWYDDGLNDEAADVVNQEFVTLNGFAVQRVADPNDQGMTPAGAAPLRPVSFVLLDSGRLYEHIAGGWTYLADGVAAVSAQGIDDAARAMIDVVFSNGQAYEYHDALGWMSLGGGVRQAAAGQGVSYVLRTNGQLFEYRDDSGQFTDLLASGVASMSAGTDDRGVNLVGVVFSSGTLSTYSDSTGWHTITGGVQAVSAGASGVLAVLGKDGRASVYHQASGALTRVATNVSEVAAGTDAAAGAMIDVVYKNGTAAEQRDGVWHTLGSGVKSVGAGRAGLIDVVLLNGNVYEHTAAGWVALTSAARQAA